MRICLRENWTLLQSPLYSQLKQKSPGQGFTKGWVPLSTCCKSCSGSNALVHVQSCYHFEITNNHYLIWEFKCSFLCIHGNCSLLYGANFKIQRIAKDDKLGGIVWNLFLTFSPSSEQNNTYSVLGLLLPSQNAGNKSRGGTEPQNAAQQSRRWAREIVLHCLRFCSASKKIDRIKPLTKTPPPCLLMWEPT